MKFLKYHPLGGAPHLFQGDKTEGATPAWEFRIKESLKVLENKTQCQLCKRLAWQIIPHSWSCLVWKRVSPLDVIDHRAHSTAIYVYWAIFSMVPPNQKNKQTNNQVFLVKA